MTGLGDYTRNVGYATGGITYTYETKTFNYDRGIRLLADIMDVEESGVIDCFVEAGSELRRTHVAPDADAFTFASIAQHAGMTVETADYASATAATILGDLRDVTNEMDEAEVTAGGRYLFITSRTASSTALFVLIMSLQVCLFSSRLKLSGECGQRPARK